MDNSFQRQETDTRQPTGFLASLHLLHSILDWLAGLMKLTEDEQKDAGIYFGNKHDD